MGRPAGRKGLVCSFIINHGSTEMKKGRERERGRKRWRNMAAARGPREMSKVHAARVRLGYVIDNDAEG